MSFCGIDEAGRGCLAGPLVVSGVILHHPIAQLNDSKKLTPKQRETLYTEILANSTSHVVFKDNIFIDNYGLSRAIKESLIEILDTLKPTRALFDGNLNYGIKTLETMVKADSQIPEVMAASIIAKVSRDNFISSLQGYEVYDFASHKGYGTRAHVEAIRAHGYSDVHRKSFKIKELGETLFG